MVGVLSCFVVGIAVWLAIQTRENALSQAEAEVELVARYVARELDATTGTPRERDLPGHVVAHGRRILVSNATGDIVATLPAGVEARGALVRYLGNAMPLAVFGAKAGVMRTVLDDGVEALAVVQDLKAPFGQVAVIQPLSGALAEWWSVTLRTDTLLLALLAVTGLLAGAYHWQAARAREAAQVCDRLGARIDTALQRGRCGLWDWDLRRGRITWSNSMFDILGMEPREGSLSVGEVNDRLDHRDINLTEVAKALIGGQTRTIDRTFRFRNAQGEWRWLRARAEVVRHGDEGPRLIGIAVDITEQQKLAEATRTAGERLQDAIETISEAFVLWDPDNRLVLCNSKFLRLHNLPQGVDAHGLRYDQIMQMGQQPLIMNQAPGGPRPSAGARSYEAQLADGRWLQINERLTKDGGYVSVGTDISIHKQHEEKLLESERRLMQTVSDLRKSRQTLELQAQQLADLAERYLEQKAEAELANR
ncbi:MAG TPA: PAS-domain containing protein, partial [Beijerinckiaceae bacterium]